MSFTVLALISSTSSAQAAFAGQYVGEAFIEYSGSLTSEPNSAGLVSFSVRADGTVAEIGGKLIGTVNSGGAISWQTPNPLNFTTGTISGNILTSSSTETNGGLTIIRSVEGKKDGAQFPAGESFTDRITDLNPTNGFSGQTRIKFLGGRFIAVGSAGSVVTSDDGLTWKRFAAPTAQGLTSISLENGLYLVTGSAGALFTSPDLVTWTKRTSPFPSFQDIIDGASGNGKFLITSILGKGATSPDGINWTEVAASAGTFEKVDFLNGQFVKYYKSNVSFSPDGITWSVEVNPGAGIIHESSGTTANLHFALNLSSSEPVVVGDNGTILVRPTSGGSWSSRTSGTTENLVGIAQLRDGFNNQPIYVIVGENGGTLISTDLITWTAGQQLNPPGKINSLQLTTSIAGYASGDSGYYAVASFSGGVVNFTEFGVTGDRFSLATNARSITHGAGRYVVAGGNFSASSPDGKTWEASQIPQLANDVAYGGGKFVAVGGNAGDLARTDRVHFSDNGLDWKKAAMPSLARPLRAVTYGSGKFIAAGQYGVVLSSEDGITWTQVGGDLSTFSNNIVDMVHANGTFVGVGGGLLISSTDSGTTFATRSAASATGLASVTWGGGTFVAVGADGNTIRSANGTSWTRTQIQAAQSATGARPVFNQVAYANDNFLATTASGQAYVSSDGGVTWQEKFTGLNKNFTGSVVANGLAVFVGQGDIIGIAVNDNSPYVTTQPLPTTLNAGTPLDLSVTVSGNNPLTYQWFQNGVPLANGGSVSGANGATLTINNITPDFSGTYKVTVTNPDGSRTSTEATVTVEGSAVVGYDAWKSGFTFPPGKDGPLDDADDDGVLNLLEFVTGSHPMQPGPSLLPGVGKLTGAQIGGTADPAKNYLTFQARVRKDRPGITLIPQSGNTLADLTGPNASSLVGQVGVPVDDPGDPDFELITYYHTVAIEDSATGTAFMRIGVSL